MAAAAGGDQRAWEALLSRYRREWTTICFSAGLPSRDVPDALSEALHEVWRSLASYRREGSFGAWSGRIVQRTASHSARRVRRRLDKEPPSSDELDDAHASDERDAVEELATADAVRRALHRLETENKDGSLLVQALHLRHYDQLRYEEIAEIMNYSVNSVGGLLHRAEARMASYLREGSEGL